MLDGIAMLEGIAILEEDEGEPGEDVAERPKARSIVRTELSGCG